MGKALRYFLEHHKMALFSTLLAFALVLFFGIKTGLNFLYFNDPAHRDEALKPWMTPRYIGMSYQLPPHIINQAMQLNPKDNRRLTVGEVATKQGVTLDELERRIRIAADNERQDRERRRKPDNGDTPLMDALIPTDQATEPSQ